MDKKEREILSLEENLKDTIENELIKTNKDNRKVKIKDIKLVGQIEWKDKINGKELKENLFEVEKEIIEKQEDGKERIVAEKSYYLGEKCIGASLGMNQVVYKEIFKESEPDKLKAVEELLEKVSEEEKEEKSFSKLHKKEMVEVLSVYLGRKVTEDEIEKLEQEINEKADKIKDNNEINDNNELEEDKKIKKQYKSDKDKNELSDKQTEKIKVNGIQKADLNKIVDGRETLGKRLDLEEYDSLYVVYSDKVNEITNDAKRNNTTYSLVGMTKDGKAKVLNDEFEIDKSVGNSGNKEQTKIKADETVSRDSKDKTVYTRKSNGMGIGCENNQGIVDMYLYQKTINENENVGIQIETQNVFPIDRDIQRLMSKNKGQYQADKIQEEVKEHIDENCEPKDIKDFDGDETTITHEHIDIDKCVQDILNYENNNGEEKIKEVFTEKEVKDKLLKEIDKNKEMDINQIVEDVKQEMNLDADTFYKEHKQ